MLCAAIDIGSNTTRVLVAEPQDGQLKKVMEQRAYTRIGKAATQEGRDRRTAKIARGRRGRRDPGPARRGARAPRRSGSSPPPRSARPRTATRSCTRSPRSPGSRSRSSSEEEEGRLAFLGATKTLGHPVEGQIGVVDVGGGSCEIVLGTVAERRREGALVQDRLRARSPRSFSSATRPRPRRSASCATTSTTSSRTWSSSSPTRRSRSAAAPRRCGRWSARCSSTRRWSAASGCSPATRSTTSPSASSSIRAGSACCRPGCCCSRSSRELLGQPLQIGKGGLREGDHPRPAQRQHRTARRRKLSAALQVAPAVTSLVRGEGRARSPSLRLRRAAIASAAARGRRVRADELLEHSEGVLDTGDIERAARHAGRQPSPARGDRGLRALLSAQARTAGAEGGQGARRRARRAPRPRRRIAPCAIRRADAGAPTGAGIESADRAAARASRRRPTTRSTPMSTGDGSPTLRDARSSELARPRADGSGPDEGPHRSRSSTRPARSARTPPGSSHVASTSCARSLPRR